MQVYGAESHRGDGIDWKDGSNQVQIINALLKNEFIRTSVVKNAYEKVNNSHRWINRAQSIIEAVTLYDV